MSKKCDKCGQNDAKVSYNETINNKTRHLDLCAKCANEIIAGKEKFLNSFFSLNPFREMDKMFDLMLKPNSKQPSRPSQIPIQIKLQQQTPKQNSAPSSIKLKQIPVKSQQNPREEKLRELKNKIDKLKQEEGIAVMLQDYLKAAEIKKKREKVQKEAEKIAFGN
jgi:protein-arginine kinase activator protein McsA